MFEEFNLNNYESRALDAIIKERMTVKDIIRKTKIPPGKVYSILKSLSNRGILSETNSRPKEFYVQNPAKLMASLIEQKQEKDDEFISKARTFINMLPSNKEEYFFKVGVTPEDNKEIQLKALKDAKQEVLQILNSKHKPNMNRKSKDIWENAIAEAIDQGVKFRAIYHKTTEIPKKISGLEKNKFQIRKTDNDMYRFDVIDNKKVLIKIIYDDPLMFGGLIYVENEKLAKNLKAIFEDIWNNSS